jgi:zinc D-Ala-D-Ala carboxypeptidase
VPPVTRPNYQLRRLVALTTLVLLGYTAWRGAGGFASAFKAPTPLARSSPTPSVSPAVAPSPSSGVTVATPPECTKGNTLAEDPRPSDWGRTLLDTEFRLRASYVPPELVAVTQAGFAQAGGLLIRSIVIDDLRALRRAAKKAGNPVDILAAYRSFAQQQDLFERRRENLGLREAERKTARAGHSEHQLGTALDFKTEGAGDVSANWESSPAGSWMIENAWRYGFIQSYPRGESALTCYDNEPWHYRYFGVDQAAAIHASGLTVRQYLWDQAHGVP